MSRNCSPRTSHCPRLGRVALVALVAIAALGAVLALPSDAWVRGVRFVDLDAAPTHCEVTGCLPDAGQGKSNTLYVRQTMTDAGPRFTDVFGTAPDPDELWLQTTLEGACQSNHRLRSLRIVGGHVGDWNHELLEGDTEAPPFSQPQPVDHDHKTIPRRNVAVHVPIEVVAESLLGSAPVDLRAWGEDIVAAEVAAGTSEQNARTMPHQRFTSVGTHAALVCRRRTDHSTSRTAIDSVMQPLEIVFLGLGMAPGEEDGDGWRDGLVPDEPEPPAAPPPIEPNLSLGFQVTDASLVAVEDPEDPCRLHLSGTVRTTEPGTVAYRFVDELGDHSQTFRVAVDHTLVAMVDHQVELVPVVVEPPLDDGSPEAFTAEDDGQIGGFAQAEGDAVGGTYQLEVVEPHEKRSGIASYLVHGCVEVAHDAVLTTPTAPPPPPGGLTWDPPTVPPVPLRAPDDLRGAPVPDPTPVPSPTVPPSLTGP